MSTAKQYRRIPTLVEAMLYEKGKHEDVMRWVREGFGKAWLDVPDEGKYAGVYIVDVVTSEGVLAALPGDYIVHGCAGEFSPCKPDIFAATYEAVTPDE